MRRCDLEHIIRAAGAIAGDNRIVVIGSQSVLAQFPEAPDSLLRSAEADVFPASNPTAADLIEGSIGEGSAFHAMFGYYAQGVDDTAAVLPAGWRDRLVPIRNGNTGGVTGLCLEVHDLAISKYVAGRPKDLEFTRLLASHGMVRKRRLLRLVMDTDLSAGLQSVVPHRIRRDFAGRRQGSRHG